MWDAFTGEITGLDDSKKIDLDLEPYGSRLIFFSDEAMAGSPIQLQHESVETDLSQQWKVKFGDSGLTADMDQLASWRNGHLSQSVGFFKTGCVHPARLPVQAASVLIRFFQCDTTNHTSPAASTSSTRSEERRVGKECSSR